MFELGKRVGAGIEGPSLGRCVRLVQGVNALRVQVVWQQWWVRQHVVFAKDSQTTNIPS